jgi:hypothetical protein
LALVSGYSTSALAYDFGPSSMFSVNGFGTLGAVHSNLDRADYTAIYLQPNGAGRSDSWSHDVDSVFGLQGAANYGKWKLVVQGITKQTARDTWKPTIEWANVRYSFTDNFSLRAGRFAMPTYLFSDTRLVRYAMTAVRPSVEVYRMLPVTRLDGAELSYGFKTGSVGHTFRVIHGKNTTDLSKVAYARNTDNTALIYDMSVGDFTVHAAAQKRKFAVILTTPPGSVGRTQEYKIADFAVNYDNGKQVVMVEVVRTWLKRREVSADSLGYVVNFGQRLGDLTPYVQYGKLDPVDDALLSGARAPASSTKTAGIRWDFYPNFALKAQYDRAQAENRSRGTFVNAITTPPALAFPVNSSSDQVSISLDFVF